MTIVLDHPTIADAENPDVWNEKVYAFWENLAPFMAQELAKVDASKSEVEALEQSVVALTNGIGDLGDAYNVLMTATNIAGLGDAATVIDQNKDLDGDPLQNGTTRYRCAVGSRAGPTSVQYAHVKLPLAVDTDTAMYCIKLRGFTYGGKK